MEAITITREEYRKKITERVDKFGIVRFMEEQKDHTEVNPVTLVVRLIEQAALMEEIEKALFDEED